MDRGSYANAGPSRLKMSDSGVMTMQELVLLPGSPYLVA